MSATGRPDLKSVDLAPRPAVEQAMRAVPLAVPALRRQAREFAAAHGAGELLQQDVALAVSEAVSNVVRHAYEGPGAGPVEFSATPMRGGFEIVVSDRGTGMTEAPSPGLGLGLKLIARVTSDFSIEHHDPGLGIVMRFVARAA
jgi:serine/threonine-protein kinase RsbW